MARLKLVAALGVCVLLAPTAGAGAAPVTTAIDDGARVTLSGNVRPEAVPQNDRGPVPVSMPMEHLQILLRRCAGGEEALVARIRALHDRRSPQFHRWLTSAELGRAFGVASADIEKVVGWLTARGLHVDGVLPSRMIVDFSGSAGAVEEALRVRINWLDVNGARHFANMNNPEIPRSLAPVVTGIVSLHDFQPRTDVRPVAPYTFGTNQCWPLTNGHAGPCHVVVPADLHTIYNFKPEFHAGITGRGQTVVVIENSDVYAPADWTTFRTTFGLSRYKAGSFTQIHPQGAIACTDPGVVEGSQDDAILDAEWANAAAPDAAIVLASCRSTATFGGLIALENLLAGANLPASVSISYEECETFDGAAANAVYDETYKEAAAEGVSVYASAGDDGAAGCDAGQSSATHGIVVSGMASSIYDVAVGGTDFGDAHAGDVGKYWKGTNGKYYASAKSYIPEIPWDDSCASVLIADWYSGSKLTYGQDGYCNAGADHTDFLSISAGSGGPSGCATGTPDIRGVVSGSCAGWPKPDWQIGFPGIRDDSVRDLPDVSLFAGNGIWSHYYLYCDSDGNKCSGTPSNWGSAGGTSFATPIMAGIQALVDQKTGSRWGNPNVVLYGLAAAEYGSDGNPACLASRGKKIAPTCVFHDVAEGDMDVDCTGSYDCYLPSGQYGVLSSSTTRYRPAFRAGTGWDFATGLGSVNVANLIKAWR